MNNTKRLERMKELETVEIACGVSKVDYAAEKLLEYYSRAGLQTDTLFNKMLSMSNEEIIEMYLNI